MSEQVNGTRVVVRPAVQSGGRSHIKPYITICPGLVRETGEVEGWYRGFRRVLKAGGGSEGVEGRDTGAYAADLVVVVWGG